jgi:hypothetical protein
MKILLLSSERSGSTAFQEFLANKNNIKNYLEPFENTQNKRFTKSNEYSIINAINILCNDNNYIIKIQMNQMNDNKIKFIINELQIDNIIVLLRKNFIEQCLSNQLSNYTDKWHNSDLKPKDNIIHHEMIKNKTFKANEKYFINQETYNKRLLNWGLKNPIYFHEDNIVNFNCTRYKKLNNNIITNFTNQNEIFHFNTNYNVSLRKYLNENLYY